MAIDSLPLTLIIAIAPLPGIVAGAHIVSSNIWYIIQISQVINLFCVSVFSFVYLFFGVLKPHALFLFTLPLS